MMSEFKMKSRLRSIHFASTSRSGLRLRQISVALFMSPASAARATSTCCVADWNVAWPGAELAVMGSEGAVNILYRQALANSDDPEAERKKLTDEYNETYANPYIAAGLGYLDDVIEPAETRAQLIMALSNLAGKKQSLPPKKHGNIPL